MQIIADSGSTKCEWLFVEGAEVLRMRTRGINAALHSPQQICEVLAELPAGVAKPEAVWFYGAGCGATFPAATEILRGLLAERFATQSIEVASDLVAAARALCGRQEGIACILGTGANSCWWDGRRIVANTPPLGYVLGDEGSGAALGRGLLNGIFKELIPLREEFLTAYGLTYEEVIRRVYREPQANRFLASLAPFVREHLDCEPVRRMVEEAFGEFVVRNLHSYPKQLPVSFVGGVAFHFAEVVREVVAKQGYKMGAIVESPAEGLLNYHDGK